MARKPITANCYLFNYTNVTETITVTGEDGSVQTIEGTAQNKEIRRPVTFMQE